MGNSSSTVAVAESAQGGGEKVPLKPRRLFLTLPDFGRKCMIEYLDMRDMVQLDTAMAHEGHERMALHEAFRGCVVYGGTFLVSLPESHGREHLNGSSRKEYANPDSLELCDGLHWAQKKGIICREFTLKMRSVDHDISGREDHMYGLIDRQRRALAKLIITRCSLTYDMNAYDGRLYTPLSVATFKGEEELVRMLVGREDVDVNQLNGHGETALHRAAEFNEVKCMRVLLDAGADTAISSAVCPSALHTAVCWGRVEAATLLLEAGAPVNALSRWGRTPLDLIDGDTPHALQLRDLLLSKGAMMASQMQMGAPQDVEASDDDES